MKSWWFLICVGMIVGCEEGGGGKPDGIEKAVEVASLSTQVTFESDDGKAVYADLYPAEAGKDAPMILLFHQARSNAGEYVTIAPKLVAEGFNCLAVDLRSGGEMWGRRNRTASAFKSDPGYEAAYADMKAALSWAKREGYPRIVVWGSSYSASLVLKLAAENQGISEVIAFSPGEYFGKDGVVSNWARNVNVPTFITCTPEEESKAGAIFDAIPIEDKSFNVPKESVHGASALREDRNPTGAKAIWADVLDFLGGIEEQPEPNQGGG